ncbi:MAG: hypothetical protein WAQ05_11625 [Rubrivivax sp.]
MSLLLAAAPALALAQRRPVLQLSALSNGVLIVDGSLTTLRSLDGMLVKLKEAQGIVWYYRENANEDPHPQATEAIRLIAAHGLPISFSSRPDFSDYIDDDGRAKPRRP